MNEKTIAQALKEQADAIEKLAQRITRESRTLTFLDARDVANEIADNLFEFQSKLRYDYKWMAEDLWGE